MSTNMFRVILAVLAPVSVAAQPFRPDIPKAWDDAALEAMQVPLAQPKYSPKQAPSEWYYKIPVMTIYKSYPVYHPDREPKGYIEWLQQQEPEVVFDPAKLRTKADWIRAGEFVFDAARGVPMSSTFFQQIRNPEWYRLGEVPLTREGIYPFARFVVPRKGEVFLANGCGGCHTRVMPDGTMVRGAQGNSVSGKISQASRAFRTDLPPPVANNDQIQRIVGAPWLGTDDPAKISSAMTEEQRRALSANSPPSVFTRHGTSVLAPTKIPDLIGIRDRRYMDHTGLLMHRTIGDLMRYGVMNSSMDFYATYDGWRPPSARSGHELPDPKTLTRFSDEQLYAMALYIYSLEPPPNPNKQDAMSRRGEKVFQREGCGGCHPAPLYTNNKLTPVQGFAVPAEHKSRYDILPVVVGTDPTLALKTRRGTGYYKVPSLKGVWYRGPFEHSGSVMALEDWFDPNRIKDDYVPTGFRGLNKTRAVKGHEFGLKLSNEDKAALIAFMKTL